MTHPTLLTANQPANRFYRGGAKIAAFRQDGNTAERVPEDWVGSATTLFGEESLGLSTLPGGQTLRDAIGLDPQFWLGADHVRDFGADPKLLVKLLDAGERLPVHAHPSAAFAREHLGRTHGKAEAWYIVEGGTVHLGFRTEVSDEDLARLMELQDSEALLGAMHRIDVAPGDSVYVPPGLPHAIGAGIFLVELQEPEDLSILLEWKGFAIDGPGTGHLGLGFPTALQAVDTRVWSPEAIATLVVRNGRGAGTLSAGSSEFFRAERVDVADTVVFPANFGVTVVLAGAGEMTDSLGQTIAVAAGDTVLLPHGCGEVTVRGSLSLLRCLPPV